MLNATILDHFYHPRGVGELDSQHPRVWTATTATPDGSTVMQLQVQLTNAKRIEHACFKTLGCPACIAVTSLICDYGHHHRCWSALQALTADYFIATLQLPRAQYYCALLGEDLVQGLIADLANTAS